MPRGGLPQQSRYIVKFTESRSSQVCSTQTKRQVDWRPVRNLESLVRRILAGMLSSAFLAAVAAAVPETGWPAYGGDEGGTRYSNLTQISPSNVGDLRVAWIFRTGELGQPLAMSPRECRLIFCIQAQICPYDAIRGISLVEIRSLLLPIRGIRDDQP